jgi:hypothetical protein
VAAAAEAGRKRAQDRNEVDGSPACIESNHLMLRIHFGQTADNEVVGRPDNRCVSLELFSSL